MSLSQAKAIKRVTAFIDWNAQLLLCGIDAKREPILAARAALKQTTRRVASCLAKTDPNVRFQVFLRLYHGWHKGWEPTENRKAAKQVIAETDFSALSVKPGVIFSAEVQFGDCLLSALPTRMHQRLLIHLPNTLRNRGNRGLEEKMVDTALAADLLVSAFQDPNEWIVVAAEDDDLVPPLFAAEAVVSARGSRVLLLQHRRQTKNYLKLDEILMNE